MKYEINKASPRHKETMHVIDVVSKALGIPIKKLTNNQRHRELVDARRICYKLLKDTMELPSLVIAGYFNKDHSSVLYHLKCHDALYSTYADYRIKFDRAQKRWKATDYIEDNMFDCINSMLVRIETLERRIKIKELC